jgi:hypothetical protein
MLIISFSLFIAEKAGLDKERRRKEGRRERSGGISLIFTESFTLLFYYFEVKSHMQT